MRFYCKRTGESNLELKEFSVWITAYYWWWKWEVEQSHSRYKVRTMANRTFFAMNKVWLWRSIHPIRYIRWLNCEVIFLLSRILSAIRMRFSFYDCYFRYSLWEESLVWRTKTAEMVTWRKKSRITPPSISKWNRIEIKENSSGLFLNVGWFCVFFFLFAFYVWSFVWRIFVPRSFSFFWFVYFQSNPNSVLDPAPSKTPSLIKNFLMWGKSEKKTKERARKWERKREKKCFTLF